MADAIGRTLCRLGVSRRHLLEWVPAAQAMTDPRLDLAGFTRRMAGAILVGAVGAVAALAFGHGSWPVAFPFVALWVASPAVAREVSAAARSSGRLADVRRRRRCAQARRAPHLAVLRDLRHGDRQHAAPRQFSGATPTPVVAHRTSPTNLGLYLLSVVCARDFGWIGTEQAIDRLEATLATMSGLERFRGHFYNWYDTRDLRPLDPRYVSTVDSGNLAGHLIALANACREWSRPSRRSAAAHRRRRRRA